MIFSPVVMKGGTRVLRPVSHVASFSWFVAVAPLMPGGVSVMVSVTVSGISTEIGLPSHQRTTTWLFGRM